MFLNITSLFAHYFCWRVRKQTGKQNNIAIAVSFGQCNNLFRAIFRNYLLVFCPPPLPKKNQYFPDIKMTRPMWNILFSIMYRERNILSSRNQKKPLQCFANPPDQTHAKTDLCLCPLCSEEQSWKKCRPVEGQRHQ